jgi:VIT1/CCC1 family predicted Fe2+/Mn2+ transporter
VLAAHLRSHQVSRVIYGSIIGLALVLVLQDHPPAAGVALASVLGTAVAVGLAELYSELVGAEVSEGRRIDRHAVAAAMDDVLAVAFGIAFPAIFFLLAVVGLMGVDTALRLAKWTGLGLIVTYGVIGALLTGRRVPHALAEGLAVGLIGAALIALKSLVH